jgi:hypothetical protein
VLLKLLLHPVLLVLTCSTCLSSLGDLQTVDNWGHKPDQCVIPGAGYPSYPWTYPLTNVCDNRIITLTLVDSAVPSTKVGILYVWKDYSDNLYLTVSINATWRINKANNAYAPGDYFHGQYLHAQPGFPASADPLVGSVSLWDSAPAAGDYPPYTNQLSGNNGAGGFR